MKGTARTIALLASAALVFVLFLGCEPSPGDDTGTWTYDFTNDGDSVEDSAWFVDAGWLGETANGYWLNQATIAAPYLFTGDFTAEFTFYLKYLSSEDEIYRFAFRLVDPNWDTPAAKYCGMAAYYASFPDDDDPYYQVEQGNGHYVCTESYENVPGLVAGQNVFKMVRTGDVVTMYMNGTLVDTLTVEASNQPSIGYAPSIHGHNSWTEADTNFYLRTLTVTYEPGERVDHDWNE
jgi:hypothetical protein